MSPAMRSGADEETNKTETERFAKRESKHRACPFRDDSYQHVFASMQTGGF
jgi:hypothetical protein